MQCVRGQTPPRSLITVFCRKGYQLCSGARCPGATALPFNSAACRPPCPALVCAITPPRSPDLWQESEVRPLAGDWMLLW